MIMYDDGKMKKELAFVSEAGEKVKAKISQSAEILHEAINEIDKLTTFYQSLINEPDCVAKDVNSISMMRANHCREAIALRTIAAKLEEAANKYLATEKANASALKNYDSLKVGGGDKLMELIKSLGVKPLVPEPPDDDGRGGVN